MSYDLRLNTVVTYIQNLNLKKRDPLKWTSFIKKEYNNHYQNRGVLNMQKYRQKKFNMAVILSILALGIGIVVTSAFYLSSFLAIVGIAIIFWGAILFYITPTNHIPITFLTASTATNVSNIERVLSEFKSGEKGVYLPPKILQDPASSLVFIPKASNQDLPKPEETKMTTLFKDKQDGIFLTPPGFALSKIFEQKLDSSFTKTDLTYLQKNLSRLFTEDLEITENVKIQIQNNKIIFEINGNILRNDCQETQKFPKTHNTLGCLLSSSIACALAKSSGKPIIIENEEQSKDGKTTKIEYQILEE
jgi:hypothetical protein